MSNDPTQADSSSDPGGPAPSLPGYEILGVLGRGGMGVVYRARQVRANRVVALKMLLSGEHASGTELARFRAEADAVAALLHPHIVAVYDVGEHAGLPYFSMEFCPGGSLVARLEAGSITPHDAATLLLKLGRGVATAHAAGIVHRDLKPGNVLFTADGEPKVSDFGLAKQLGRVGARAGEPTASGTVLGTPTYMAPEQASSSRAVGPPADVYSLGAILYELLTGRPPLQGATTYDTLLLVLTEDPTPPRQLNPDVPRDLEAVCLRCLEKDPTRRYPTAAELAADVQRYLDGEAVSANTSGLAERLLGALERVQLQERFAGFGALLLALVPVMVLPEAWIQLVAGTAVAPVGIFVARLMQAAAFVGLVAWFRGGRLLPQGAAERQLWAVWGGYLLGCFTYGLAARAVVGSDTPALFTFYPGFAALTGLAFVSLAPTIWGYCAVIGVGYFVLAALMPLAIGWAPLAFGLAWGAVLVGLGVRLRRLGRAAR